MPRQNLLASRSDIYTQNGEDGIIAAIFAKINSNTKMCCEFGAWDGIHLSNCRNLILNGWSALMIEGEEPRYQDLVKNYANNPQVYCVNKFVDAATNSLGSILLVNNIKEIDFLSIDIDGLDYEVFETLDISPKVICIEVNAAHNPENGERLSKKIAKDNVGQSLNVFVQIANAKGYDLICYNGNAFFIRRDINAEAVFTVLSVKEAYQDFLNDISIAAKEWLYMVNLGLVNPHFKFNNPYLTREALGINRLRSIGLKLRRKV